MQSTSLDERTMNISFQEFSKLKNILDQSDYILLIISFNGRINYTNSKLSKILGLSKDVFLKSKADEIIANYVHPDDIDKTLQVFNETGKGKSIKGFQNRFCSINGSYKWLSWMLLPFCDEKLYYAIAREITEQKDVEEELERTNKKVNQIFNSITDAFFVIDKHWKFSYVNKTAKNYFLKLTGKDVKGIYLWDIFPKVDLYYKKFLEASLTQKATEFEAYTVLTDDWVQLHVYPSHEGLSIYFSDISERKRLEKELEIERNYMHTILNGLPGLVYLQNTDNDIIFANDNFKAIYGVPVNKKCYSVFFEKEKPCHKCPTLKTLEGKTTRQWQSVINDVIYDVYEYAFDSSDGQKLIVKQLLDITKKKLIDEEIARLDKLNLVGELAASIAHEVRNPMTTVRGFLQLLKKRSDDAENSSYFDLMISELDRANSIITEFLSIAKTKKELTKVKLNELISLLYPLIYADALNQDKQVVMELKAVNELSMNEREIRQLVLNLARNGLEAMPPGGHLKIKTYDEQNFVVLAIQDEGSGIKEDILTKLGTPFLTTKENGTGLGLATCYNIAQRHKAKIDVESSPSGTTFFIRFRLRD